MTIVYLVLIASALCLSGRHLSIRCSTAPEWLDKALGIGAMPVIVVACVVRSLFPRRVGSRLLERIVGK